MRPSRKHFSSIAAVALLGAALLSGCGSAHTGAAPAAAPAAVVAPVNQPAPTDTPAPASPTEATVAATAQPSNAPAASSDASGSATGRFNAAGEKFVGSLEDLNTKVRADSQSHDRAALRADLEQLRQLEGDFDAAMRAITFPDAAHVDVDALLAANRAVLADLDTALSADGVDATVEALGKYVGDQVPRSEAIDKVASDLGAA